MPCRLIDFSVVPYDDASIAAAYNQGGCTGITQHFGANAINVGDCVIVDGSPYRISGVVVWCLGSAVFIAGNPPVPYNPDHTHSYSTPGVQVGLWLAPMAPEEVAICQS